MNQSYARVNAPYAYAHARGRCSECLCGVSRVHQGELLKGRDNTISLFYLIDILLIYNIFIQSTPNSSSVRN